MQKRNASLLAVLAAMSLFSTAPARADDEDSFKARLNGYQETPAVSSTGRGEFRARVRGEDRIDWDLRYDNLEGTTTGAAHVHLGQKDVAGGVSFFLCGGTKPPCTPGSGSFSGTATAADIIGPAPQGIAPGEIAEIIRAMRAGKTYANVHTDKHPAGEIRGQIRGDREDD